MIWSGFYFCYLFIIISERYNNDDSEEQEGGRENGEANKTSEAFSHVRVKSMIPKAKRHVCNICL